MKKSLIISMMFLIGLCTSVFTSCKNLEDTGSGKESSADVNFTDVNWDEDISWFVGTWQTTQVISDGIDITSVESQEIEFSSERKFVKWTSSSAGNVVPPNISFDEIKDILKTSYHIQVSDDKTKLKQTATSTIYYFTKK